MGPTVITGSGPLADELRRIAPFTECATTVVVVEASTTPIAFEALTDADFDASWEQPMRRAIAAFQDAHRAGHRRIIAAVPTIAMSGAPGLAHVAATAEAVRVMVKSAARQWGGDGVTVNCVAAAPELFGIDASSIGAVSLAPPALASPASVATDVVPLIEFLGSMAAHRVTGATMTVDGGVWMSP